MDTNTRASQNWCILEVFWIHTNLAQTWCAPSDFRQTWVKRGHGNRPPKIWQPNPLHLVLLIWSLAPSSSHLHTPIPKQRTIVRSSAPTSHMGPASTCAALMPYSLNPQSTESHRIRSSAPESSTLYGLPFSMV